MLTSSTKIIDRYNHYGPNHHHQPSFAGLTRPINRQPLSQLSIPSTPPAIRATRVEAAVATNNAGGNLYFATNSNSNTTTRLANENTATVTTYHTNNNNNSLTHAQTAVARALAAQEAARQKRLLAAAAAEKQHPSQQHAAMAAPFEFGVGFMGFGGVPFGKTRETGGNVGVGVIGQGRLTTSTTAASNSFVDIPEHCIDMFEELSVDLSLPLVSSNASPVESPKWTSPSAPVDISAFLPPPGPPPLIATDATIAASAVPLADWASELVWLLVSRPRVGTDLADPRGRAMGLTGNQRFASFKKFVSATLNATLPSPQCLFLALYYLTQLPVGNGYNITAGFGSSNNDSNILGTPAEQFRKTLYEGGEDTVWGVDEEKTGKVARLAITLGLILGNKWLEDNTFTTRTWHEVTSLPQRTLKQLETASLTILGFSLHVNDRTWLAWLRQLRSYTSTLVAREPIGKTVGANGAVVKRLDALVGVAKVLEEEPGSGEDTMKCAGESGEDAVRRMERQVLDAIEDEDEDEVVFPRTSVVGRLPPFQAPTANTGSGFSRKTGHSRTASLPVSMDFCGGFEVDMQLDEPLVGGKNSNGYAAVYRPAAPMMVNHQPLAMSMHHTGSGGGSGSGCSTRRNSYDHADFKITPPPPPGLWPPAHNLPQNFERPYYVLHPHQAQFSRPQQQTQPQTHAYAYSWSQVEAEMKAKERESAAVSLAWPRPSEMEWSGGMWTRPLSFAAGA